MTCNYYGARGNATAEKNAAGFRLLAVSTEARGLGIGKSLTETYIRKAKKSSLSQVIIHSTKAMQAAWKCMKILGSKRAAELDFMQGETFGIWISANCVTFLNVN